MEDIIRNPIDFDLFEFRKHKLQKLTRNIKRKVHGLDTETLNGYCKLLADGDGNYILSKSINSVSSLDFAKFLNFLTSHRFRSSHNFFFNLNYDVNAIIKYMPKKYLNELYNELHTNYLDTEIFYIPKKVLRLTKNKNVYKFYDIMQFLKGSLESNAKKYFELEKYIVPIDGAQLGTSKVYWHRHLNNIIKYCINDAKLTKRLGDMVNNTIIENLHIYPCTYMSKASLCKEFVRKRVNIPDINKIPRNALKYGFYSYAGGRFEVIKKGNVGKCKLYDINSAYPFTIYNLLDVNNGKWKRVNCMHEKADYGFYIAKIFIKYNTISPIGIPIKAGVIAYPIMHLTKFITKKELLAYEKFIDFEIIDGWEFFSNGELYPFRNFIKHVYKLKQETPKSEYEYDLYKINMNSLSGCFYEKYIRKEDYTNAIEPERLNQLPELPPKISIITGKLFNPIYATLITADTRINLFKSSIGHFSNVVAYATDSILFDGNVEMETNNKLGGWGLQANDNTIVLKGGIYKIGKKLKSRGIKRVGNIKTPFGNYDNIFDYIEAQPQEIEYPITMNRPLSFIEVLLHHLKHNIEDINVFTEMTYRINLNKDYKRLWNEDFINGAELFEKSIESTPLMIQ